MFAIELQHTSIALPEIEARARSYARARIAQIWIPFLSAAAMAKAEHRKCGLFIPKYSARPFERWIHGLESGKGMWMYDPRSEQFWSAHFRDHQLYVEERTYYDEGGDEVSSGGYWRPSKRWRDLELTGPFEIKNLKLASASRLTWSKDTYTWPGGQIAKFVRNYPPPCHGRQSLNRWRDGPWQGGG
jgi:competence protein CoiA